MKSLNKTQKMLQIVRLASRPGGIRTVELLDRFQIEPRTLRRYLADFREVGIPIVEQGRGMSRAIEIDPAWRRTGVTLSLTEVLSLHFGRKMYTFIEDTSFAADMSGAIEKLQPVIKQTHADLAQQLDAKFIAVPEPTKHWTEHSSGIIDDILTSLVYNYQIKASYRKIYSNNDSRYELRPYTLASYRNGLYLFALDVAVNQVKTFAVDRFSGVKALRNQRFALPSDWNPRDHCASAFGIIASDPVVPVQLAFRGSAVAYIRERTWHSSQTVQELPGGRLKLCMTVSVGVELISWILSHGPHVEVLGPPELRAQIASQIDRTLSQYGS